MKKLLLLFCAVMFLASCDGISTRGPSVGSKESMPAVAVPPDTNILKGLKLGSRFVLVSYTPIEKPAQTSTLVFKKLEEPPKPPITKIISITNDFEPNKIVQIGTMEDGSIIYALIIRTAIGTQITFSLKNGSNVAFMSEVRLLPTSQQPKPIKLFINKVANKYVIVEEKDN
jgi:hypothetical protein